MSELHLEPEQVLLFKRLVEALRSVPREDRSPFFCMRAFGGTSVQGNGLAESVLDEDVEALADSDLIRWMGESRFRIPQAAFAVYDEIRARREPVFEVEQDIVNYLDASSFQSGFPAAYSLWSDAARLLWHTDSARELSTIGHKCREAMQEFVTALLERHAVTDANPDKAKTRDRFSSVLQKVGPQLGEAKTELLEALFGLWGAAGALVQRQEHAGQREGEALTWEDARRVVFQTAVLMCEIDRTLP